MSGHGYRYTGKGVRFRAVPPRDLTQAEYDALAPREQRTVDESGAYEPIPAPKTEPKKQDAGKDGDA